MTKKDRARFDAALNRASKQFLINLRAAAELEARIRQDPKMAATLDELRRPSRCPWCGNDD